MCVCESFVVVVVVVQGVCVCVCMRGRVKFECSLTSSPPSIYYLFACLFHPSDDVVLWCVVCVCMCCVCVVGGDGVTEWVSVVMG